jgi:hypothetical protein
MELRVQHGLVILLILVMQALAVTLTPTQLELTKLNLVLVQYSLEIKNSKFFVPASKYF